MEYIGGQDQSGRPSNEEEKLNLAETRVSEVMQPGRPFLRSLQSSFLKHVQGKVHCESETLSVSRQRQRCLRPERVDSALREAPLERSDIANRVLAAVKACSMVDSAKVTEFANFEEELQLQRGDVVVLVLAVLKKYGLSLSYVEARRMATCTELIDYIESQVCQDDSSSNEDH